MSGQIYLFFDGSGLWKIGITRDHKKRLKQLQIGNPTIREAFYMVVEHPSVLELELHSKFEDKRIRGEWFDLSAEDFQYIFHRFFGDLISRPEEEFVVFHRMVSVYKVASNLDFIKFADKDVRRRNG